MKPNLTKIAAAAALAVGMAFAQTAAPPAKTESPSATRPFARGAWGHGRMMNQLNLTAAQKAQAKTIFETARQDAKPIRGQLMQNHQSLWAAVKANDTAKIQELSTTQGNLRGQLVANRSLAMAKFYQILTPEQRAKADQMHQNMQTRVRERMQQRRGTSGE
jgi:Spy/CpxP family protein refolding chaperone